jgi:hypothetical protein
MHVHGGRVSAGGYFHAARGRHVRIIVVEKKGRRTVGRRARNAVATGEWWQRLPELHYKLRTGRSKVSLRIKALGRHGDTLIDDLHVRAAGR